MNVERFGGAGRAVFLSYASQDAEAARRICDALRAAGIEVWFDQNELRGGDAWDQKIRKQIKDCALFVPIISANTQARLEGYFRLEWKLAEDRSHLMAKGKPFIVPVCIDETKDWDAHVPDAFMVVQWMRLPRGETRPAFCERVNVLLSGDGEARPSQHAPGTRATTPSALPVKSFPRRWSVPSLAGLATLAALAWWQPWKKAPDAIRPSAPSAAAAADPVASAELASIRARIVPDRWTSEDFPVLKPRLDRIIRTNPDESDAWALRSIIASLQVLRTFDYGTKVLMAGKSDAAHALRLVPGAPLGELALGLHFVAMTTRGGDPHAATPHIERAMARLPRDSLTRYIESANAAWTLRYGEHERLTQAWLKDDPTAPFPMWVLGTHRMYERRADEAEQWAERCARAAGDINGVRALVTLLETKLLVRADPAAARAVLDRVPAGSRTVHRVVLASWLLALFEQKWDEAIQELARLPDTVIYDRGYHGPKALLAGIAHQKAGRNAPAAAQFAEAERVLRELLREDADDEELRTALALTLAYAGRRTEARDELAAIEPLVRGRPAYLYSGYVQARIAETHAVLGDVEAALPWLRLIFAGPSAVPYTPGSFRRDPRFASLVKDPRVEAMLAEFSAREAAAAPTQAPEKSVAVLAFENLSAEKDNEYFSDGISEELLNVLAKVPGLRVAARTSAFYFKGKQVPIAEIAKQLNVAYVVEGSVRKAGSRVRITAQLINAADGFHVWSDNFDRELKDIFAVQDEIAGLIAQNLKLKLGAAARVAKTVNPEAHRLVLEGRYFWNLRSEEGFKKAEAAFEQALEIDRTFAPAHSGLAELCAIRPTYYIGGTDASKDRARAELAANRALQLDPSLPEPHAALGFHWTLLGRLAEAEAAFQRAFALNPNLAIARLWHHQTKVQRGQLDLAIAELEATIRLDPLSVISYDRLAENLAFAGRFTDAAVTVDRAMALRPGGVTWTRFNQASILERLGRRDEAIAAAMSVRPRVSDKLSVRYHPIAIGVLHRLGQQQVAESYAMELGSHLPADSFVRGFASVARGRFEEALPYLEEAPAPFFSVLFWGVMFDPYRSDSRFHALLVKLGCVEEYKVARETLARMLKEPAAAEPGADKKAAKP